MRMRNRWITLAATLVAFTALAAPATAQTHKVELTPFVGYMFGGGVKIFPSERIGIRLAGHLYSTILSSGSGFWCGTGGCGVGLSGWGFWQGDVQAGLTIAL